eukprot:354041-Chlamydomonas_euryale.AAC.7
MASGVPLSFLKPFWASRRQTHTRTHTHCDTAGPAGADGRVPGPEARRVLPARTAHVPRQQHPAGRPRGCVQQDSQARCIRPSIAWYLFDSMPFPSPSRTVPIPYRPISRLPLPVPSPSHAVRVHQSSKCAHCVHTRMPVPPEPLPCSPPRGNALVCLPTCRL